MDGGDKGAPAAVTCNGRPGGRQWDISGGILTTMVVIALTLLLIEYLVNHLFYIKQKTFVSSELHAGKANDVFQRS